MHHPQSLDPLPGHALGSGLRAATTRDDDSSPAGFPVDDEPSDRAPSTPRFTLRAALLERHPETTSAIDDAACALRIVDVPTFFFYPFDHIAHQCAAEAHGRGSMRRVAVHGASEHGLPSARTLLLALDTSEGVTIERDRETRFTDLEALIVAIDAVIEWIGLDVRPPLDLTLDIDFERDGIVDPNDVTLTVRTTRDAYGRLEAHLVLFNEATAEALLLRTTQSAEKDLPVYPAPRKLAPASEPVLPASPGA